ncbi:MAG TPA: hypothetical protein VK553_03180 [Candidatus Nitrosopolaris rasttigaisensis]|nr:hypothetical protein [Candidatus Nitrosopolaris rasttigaisensis]
MTKDEQIAITKYDLYYESRMTKMETVAQNLQEDMKEIKLDLRWMLGLMITFTTIMPGLLAKGFHWL